MREREGDRERGGVRERERPREGGREREREREREGGRERERERGREGGRERERETRYMHALFNRPSHVLVVLHLNALSVRLNKPAAFSCSHVYVSFAYNTPFKKTQHTNQIWWLTGCCVYIALYANSDSTTLIR